MKKNEKYYWGLLENITKLFSLFLDLKKCLFQRVKILDFYS